MPQLVECAMGKLHFIQTLNLLKRNSDLVEIELRITSVNLVELLQSLLGTIIPGSYWKLGKGDAENGLIVSHSAVEHWVLKLVTF
jgi:hypothetical protein